MLVTLALSDLDSKRWLTVVHLSHFFQLMFTIKLCWRCIFLVAFCNMQVFLLIWPKKCNYFLITV